MAADRDPNDTTKLTRAASSAVLDRWGDKIIGALLVLALSVGGYFAKGVQDEVRDTRTMLGAEVQKVVEKLQGIGDRVRDLEAARFGHLIEDHETRLRELEKQRRNP